MNGITTDFITSGIKVLAQKSGENTIVWQIDGNGNTVGFNYNNTPYFYIKNAQGDIIAITDISGNLVAKYTYDSWGKLVSIKDSNDVDKTTDENFIGYVNPIRYRGYYYDSETGLYYLNARYYDPEVGRFINADGTLDGGYNLFCYCYNDPVNFYDLDGKEPICIGGVSKKIKGVLYNYNCWGWAIQKITGKFKACNPSGFDNAIAKQGNVGILADWTKNSIEELGATADILGELNDVQLNDEMNNLQDNQYMVAMRLGMYGAYHYMRYDNGVWTHKWGNSGNLWQLNEITPNNEDAWTTYEIDPKSTGKVRIVTGLNGEPFRPYKNSRTWYIKVTLPKKTSHCVIA